MAFKSVSIAGKTPNYFTKSVRLSGTQVRLPLEVTSRKFCIFLILENVSRDPKFG